MGIYCSFQNLYNSCFMPQMNYMPASPSFGPTMNFCTYTNSLFLNYFNNFFNRMNYTQITPPLTNSLPYGFLGQNTLMQKVPNQTTIPSYNNAFSEIGDTFRITTLKSPTPVQTNKSATRIATPAPAKVSSRSSSSGTVNHAYVNLSQKQAEIKAQNDPNLERLRGGQNWSISSASFRTDIPFAKKGTNKILDEVSKIVKSKTGQDLVITSALGTAGNSTSRSPHVVGNGYASHHNAENPKLDIRTNGNGAELAAALRSTGYFSRISIEKDHLDVQIDPRKFA